MSELVAASGDSFAVQQFVAVGALDQYGSFNGPVAVGVDDTELTNHWNIFRQVKTSEFFSGWRTSRQAVLEVPQGVTQIGQYGSCGQNVP